MMTRDEFEAALRKIISHTGGWEDSDQVCPYCHCGCNGQMDDRTTAAMALFDQQREALGRVDTEKYWTARRGAEFLGLKSPAAARSTFSRNKIESAFVVDGKALYPAAEIRALRQKRQESR